MKTHDDLHPWHDSFLLHKYYQHIFFSGKLLIRIMIFLLFQTSNHFCNLKETNI